MAEGSKTPTITSGHLCWVIDKSREREWGLKMFPEQYFHINLVEDA